MKHAGYEGQNLIISDLNPVTFDLKVTDEASTQLTLTPDCAAFRYRRNPWHPVSLPLDLSCRHVIQRLVLVFVGATEQIWVLLVRGTDRRALRG